MGWKTIKGHRYYYRVRREHGRVVTEYSGRGETAGLLATLVDTFRAERAVDLEREREQREYDARIDEALDSLLAEVKAEAKEVLVAAGCYQHKRQWRRRRRSEYSGCR
jgi:hypothetical protein